MDSSPSSNVTPVSESIPQLSSQATASSPKEQLAAQLSSFRSGNASVDGGSDSIYSQLTSNPFFTAVRTHLVDAVL